MTNLYQTSSGTPVTADGQPVGLVLDKSRSGVNLVPNGDFNTDSDWVLSGLWYIQDGKLFDPVAPSGFIESSSFSLTGGQEYEVSIQSTGSGGNPTLFVKKGTSHVHTFTIGSNPSDGVYTSTFTAPSDGSDYYLDVSSSNYIGSFQFISVRQVNSVALGSELVTNGTFDTDSDWNLGVGDSIANGQLTIGTTTAFITQPFTFINGKTYRVTVDVIADDFRNVRFPYDGKVENIVYIPESVGTHTLTFVSGGSSTLFFGYAINANDAVFDNVSVKEVLGNHAVQPTASSRPTYNANPDRLTLDLVDDGLLVDIPTGGWDGYMTVGTDLGTATYGVSLPEGNYELGGDYFFGNTINNVLFREGEMQPAHRQAIEQIFVDEGAKESYGDVTSFTNYWRGKNITEFPLIDTSKGTNFSYAWRGNNLTSFPLIDTSSGTNFSYAWAYNNLTSFPLIDTSSGTNFYAAWRNNNLTSFPLIDTSSGTSFQAAWYNNNLTSFPLIDTSNGTTFAYAWYNNSLTEFPLLDTSSGTDFSYAWYNNNLTSFPLIDTSNVTNFSRAWERNNLTSFPLINTSNVTNFSDAWARNDLASFPLIDTSSGKQFGYTWQSNQLTSFPALDLSNGNYFRATWRGNPLVNFPANMFDNCGATNFDQAFAGTNLSQQSIDNILVSIESNGTSNGTFTQSGGSAPSSVGESAITALRSRGWTVTVTGGF